MGEFMRTAAGFFVSGFAGTVLGGLLVWLRVGHRLERSGVEPADAFDGIEEETAGAPVIKPELAWWFTADTEQQPMQPMPRPAFDSLGLSNAKTISLPVVAPDELKNDTTKRIRIRPESDGNDDEGFPWWAGPTVPQSGIGRHRSGEYPVLDGAR